MVSIVSGVKENLFIVISAMGKVTNAMETVLDSFMKADKKAALEKLNEVESYHINICIDLFGGKEEAEKVLNPLFFELEQLIINGVGDDYDSWYDRIVSYGEIISTTIVSAYLNKKGIANKWLDMRKLIITDSNFREANVNMNESRKKLKSAVNFTEANIYIGQGFIGANIKGNPTTLGREGSDYTAAVVGNLLNAESVSIWKDVQGILNADPRLFPDTVKIPELTYKDAVELAYSGAQIIHPKTIKPLENKNIPLYVRPFSSPTEAGSVIKSSTSSHINMPVLILKSNQVLVSLLPHDFSFVLEESLQKAFLLMNKHRLKISAIQSSAVSISVCVDNTRYLPAALDELSNDFKVKYNENLELLTIRGKTDDVIEKYTKGRKILLLQSTRTIARILMRVK